MKTDKAASGFILLRRPCPVVNFATVLETNSKQGTSGVLAAARANSDSGIMISNNVVSYADITQYSVFIVAKDGKSFYSCAEIFDGERYEVHSFFAGENLQGLISVTKYTSDNHATVKGDLLGDSISTTAQEYCFSTNECNAANWNSGSEFQDCRRLDDPRLWIDQGVQHYYDTWTGTANLTFGDLSNSSLTLIRSVIVKSSDGDVCSSLGHSKGPIIYDYPTGPGGPDVTYYAAKGKYWMPQFSIAYLCIVLLTGIIWSIGRHFAYKDVEKQSKLLSRGSLTGARSSRYLAIDKTKPATGDADVKMETIDGGSSEGKVDSKNKRNSVIIETHDDMELHAYKNNYFGTAAFVIMHSFSCLLFVIYFVLMYDYYFECQIKGIDSPCLYGSYSLFTYKINSQIFFAVWLFFFVWFLFQIQYKKTYEKLL